MSALCSKAYSITINPGTFWWWEMEDTINADSVHGVIWGPWDTPVVGKVNNAAALAAATATTKSATTGALAALAAPAGTLVGWLRHTGTLGGTQNRFIVSINTGGLLLQLVGGVISGVDPWAGLVLVGLSTSPFATFDDRFRADPGIATYFYFRMWFDQATGEVGVQINLETKVIHTLPFSVPATMQLTSEATAAPASLGIVFANDEMAFFPHLLTDAQYSYLYNGGTGRTLPITLP